MTFIEQTPPCRFSYQSASGPTHSTQIVTVDSGAEFRVSRWDGGRLQYNGTLRNRSPETVRAFMAFVRSVRGSAIGFRLPDDNDCSTASDHVGAPSHTDMQLGVGDGVATQFQLIKRYAAGDQTQIRTIEKPRAGTTLVGLDGSLSGSGWTVNTATGLLTFSSPVASGVVVTAGCLYDVPVRFGEAVDGWLSMSIETYGTSAIDSIPMIEIIDEGATRADFNYGGSKSITSADTISLSVHDGAVLAVTMTTSGKAVRLPATTSLVGGALYFMLTNSGAQSWSLQTSGGSAIRTLAAGETCIVNLGVNASNQKTWYVL